ncbi:hypothetical protein [Bradyrhizobium sp. AUGA SZCCT0283]|uniref:hypothetical protein n=1 Tax=Bradyrhizobium sp. AUGA SZCCT0283 TaxID=2807671 RepID=UPI001BA9CE01|nr:hypothetical protein [Bradyrhizobium sp. AUGA SZCCT0283]MBR1278329.1 hypothetical protein [Bradyrhizobium sp. AUGA SZCCT0283]
MLSQFERHRAASCGTAAVSSKSINVQTNPSITGSWRDIVAVILPVSPSRAGEAIQSLQTVGIASPLPLRSLR